MCVCVCGWVGGGCDRRESPVITHSIFVVFFFCMTFVLLLLFLCGWGGIVDIVCFIE